ncbi:MAG: hypothetical protein IPN76_17295 [Saprospiraceae bacterium]|nr:hypothetical protein [Saprospiraceae bacterium]
MPYKNKDKRTQQIMLVVITLLLLALLGTGFLAYKYGSEKDAISIERESLAHQLGEMEALKIKLQHDVDSLQESFAIVVQENQSLQGSVAVAQSTIDEKQAAIKKLTRQKDSQIKSLKAQLESLLAAKADLESTIRNLQEENDSLRQLTGKLTEDLALERSENATLLALNATIQEELKRLTLANFKATAFRVEVEKRKSVATAKSRQAKRLVVSFDLAGVKVQYQGVRSLYLVVTDDKGTPIRANNPVQAKVNVNGQEMDIQAVKKQQTSIMENQRLTLTHELEDRLKRGFYRVAIYTDIGLLGAASFRLQ